MEQVLSFYNQSKSSAKKALIGAAIGTVVSQTDGQRDIMVSMSLP